MRWLLDTVAVSEPVKAHPTAAVIHWLEGVHASDLALSAVSLMELERGIARIAPTNGSKAAKLRQWVDHDVRAHIEILPFDDRCARVAGDMQAGPMLSRADSMIAATALARGLTVVTRNVKDFERFPVQVFSPWDA